MKLSVQFYITPTYFYTIQFRTQQKIFKNSKWKKNLTNLIFMNNYKYDIFFIEFRSLFFIEVLSLCI